MSKLQILPRWCSGMEASTALLVAVVLAFIWAVALGQTVYKLDDSMDAGRTFNGIGGLSAGASSKLLVNYPEPQRSEILDLLFKPSKGANLHLLKVEVGGDVQSTDGTEASHMRSAYEENFNRGYEWWLMKEAKKRNPALKLWGLPWGWPAWVGGGRGNIYADPTGTATYIIKWILGAKKAHNLTIDYIGIWNEKMYNTTYIKTLRKVLDASGLGSVKIVAADYFGWGLVKDMEADPELAAAIFAVGVHYPGTRSTAEAQRCGKLLWSSEDYSTVDNNVGAGCWARILNQNYVNGYMSSTTAWALVAAWYDGLPYSGCGLLSANSPWSGHYQDNSPLWITAHTSQFAKPGWHYLPHGAGVDWLKGGGSYVAFSDPSRTHLAVVIETMSHNHSLCIRPALPFYTVEPQNITLLLGSSFANITQVFLYYSHLGFDGKATTLFKNLGPLQVKERRIHLHLGVDEVWTIATLNVSGREKPATPPRAKPFPLPYLEDFDAYAESEEPYNFSPQLGSFAVTQTGPPRRGVMRQEVTESPVTWSGAERAGITLVAIGDPKWANISVKFLVRIPEGSKAQGFFVGVRVTSLGASSGLSPGIFLFVDVVTRMYNVTASADRKKIIQTGAITGVSKDWMPCTMTVKGTTLHAAVGNFKISIPDLPMVPASGFVVLGVPSFSVVDFDNVALSAS